MKTLVATLIIISLFQSTIVPLDLVLIILICRSYIRPSRSNLFYAFGFGLLLSHLNLTAFGFQSIVYLTIVVTVESLSKTRLAGNALLIIPLSLLLLPLNQLALSIFSGQSVQIFPKVFYESLLSLPVLYVLKLWEERFIFQKDIKLKV